MKLIDLIEHLDNLDDDQVIYITAKEPFRNEIEAVMRSMEEDFLTRKPPTGMEYFLEVPLAKEVLEVWEKWRNGKKPTLHEKYLALVYYATKDAYMPEE